MTPSAATLLRRLLLGGVMLAWVVAAWFGSSGRSTPDVAVAVGAAPFVVLIGLFLWRLHRPVVLLAGAVVLLILLLAAWPTLREHARLVYLAEHVGTHLALAFLFGQTLVGDAEPLITRFARAMQPGGVLSECKRRYTRRATLAWTLFFVGNASVSLGLYVFAPHAVWAAYASLLTGPLVGAMFVVEHVWRRFALPPEERPRFIDVARAWRHRSSVGHS